VLILLTTFDNRFENRKMNVNTLTILVMKKVKHSAVLIALFCSTMALFSGKTYAQEQYKTAAGLLIDMGDGVTLVGPHIKNFFTANHGGEGAVLFGNDLTVLQAQYQYHQQVTNANGLQWYLGVGPSFIFGDNSDTEVSLVSSLGLDYKITNAPLSLSFDWRPRMMFYDGDSDFLPGRFGLGFRFVFK